MSEQDSTANSSTRSSGLAKKMKSGIAAALPGAAMLLLSMAARPQTANADCGVTWTEPTNASNPMIVSGEITLCFNPNACTFDYAELWIGCPDSPISPIQHQSCSPWPPPPFHHSLGTW
jgi:hypothetical protein